MNPSGFYVDPHFVPFLSREDKKKKLRNLNVRLLSSIFLLCSDSFLNNTIPQIKGYQEDRK